jgi:FKBP-type peptidyl-prolyl cis-trans isomerase (trigger factor)
MISALNRLADGTVKLTITIPKGRVTSVYQKTLQQLAAEVQLKGFRKGKASLPLVEKELGKSKIYEEVLKTLVPEVYLEAIKENQLKPIANPRVAVVSLEENKDWQIEATTCELPTVDLGNYREAVKKALAAEKIWVPGKDKTRPTKNENQSLEKIFQTLLSTSKLQIPEILTQEEVDRMLSRLIDQTNRLGITVEQYLTSSSKTKDQLRSEYRQEAEKSLKLEFILNAIAETEKTTVSEAEVERMIAAAPDEKSRQMLDNPLQRAHIQQLLRKRRVIDSLSQL